jgi:hypothetical protein
MIPTASALHDSVGAALRDWFDEFAGEHGAGLPASARIVTASAARRRRRCGVGCHRERRREM